MLLSHHSDTLNQQLSAALHDLSSERPHSQRVILPASIQVDQFAVPQSVSAFLTSFRDYVERTSAVSLGTY
jgi:hypothetical protein